MFRVGGDEFTVILTDRDYTIRKELMVALHERSAAHITTGGAVVSGGLSGYRPAEDERLRDLFQRADERMYQEKKLLKSLGAATRDDTEEEAQEQALLPESHQAILKVRRHLLIVDDESINRSLLADALRGGYELIFASDGYEALEQVREHRDELALILLDLIMPHMGGMEVLKALKNDEELKDIPVIILASDQDAELDCLNLGAMDFIPKPYPRWEIIRARVNKCIELSEDRDIIRSTERDSLTRLFNIDYFLRYVKKFDQHYWDMPMDAVVLDVTHFHMLNERYGKQYGDAILRRIGERVRTLARSLSGVGCRQGADTFLIYCPHQEDYGPILEGLSADLAGDEASSSRVRLRLGVYSQVDKNLEIEQRFDRAKCAADSVKTGHLQAVGIYDTQLHEQALFRERLLEDFRTSLAEHRFVVCYQPKFDIRPDVPLLASAEALVRWNHPELGLLKPRTFIPLLEENGLILELDTFVWRETARQIRLWKQQHGFSVPVSVNVSRIDMLTPNLKELFQQILDENGLSTADLMLEITESAYTGDAEQVLTAARELRGMGMGFRIEMDDFGSGYSSLGMLSHLPIDALKLDISFIRSAFGEKRDVRMIELIIDIADYLHVPVVAEGVETEEQYLPLKAMGCDLVQGYYFSRPVPAPEFDHFLSERGAQSMKVTNAFRKSCLSLSKALTNNFEDIFYVYLVTDYYLEFYTSPQGELQIRPGGTDFFREARESILRDVPEPERATLAAALEKENLRGWLGREETVPFVRSRAGVPARYCLQTVRTRSSDDHHIVIAIRPD